MSKKEERIFERNPDTGQIRSRVKGAAIGTERIERIGEVNRAMRKQAVERYGHAHHWTIREDILSDLWAVSYTHLTLPTICSV